MKITCDICDCTYTPKERPKKTYLNRHCSWCDTLDLVLTFTCPLCGENFTREAEVSSTPNPNYVEPPPHEM